MSTDQTLSGKTIVITGASSGFGRGSAEKLAELGANVVLAARRAEVLDQLVVQIASNGGTAIAVEMPSLPRNHAARSGVDGRAGGT